MKIEIHKSEERGENNYGWLHTKHSFSFANYYNPNMMGFGTLRVINEDIIKPSSGFPDHPHRDMEIVTIVLEGILEHRDNMGNHGIVGKGDVQRMSAGSGIVHSEFNGSGDEDLHLLQIWIETSQTGISPSYEQIHYNLERNSIIPIVSNEEGGVSINQDCRFLMTELDDDFTIEHSIGTIGNGMYVFVIDGTLDIDGNTLESGDAAAITNVGKISLKALEKSHVLIIEVPME